MNFRLSAIVWFSSLVFCQDIPILTFVDPVRGAVQSGQTSTFQFAGTADDVVTVTLTENSPTTTAGPCFDVLDPKGIRVGTDCASTTASARIRLPLSGYYRLLVYENGKNQPLSFTISVGCTGRCPATPGPDLPVPPAQLSFGQTFEGILQVQQTITFSFPGTANDDITATLVERDPTTTATACVEIQDSTGVRRGYVSGSTTATLKVKLVGSGPHRLLIYECQRNQPLAYRITLACTGLCPPTSGEPPPPPPTSLSYAQVYDGILQNQQTTSFQFTGTANDVVVATLTERAPLTTASTCVEVWDPRGIRLGADTGSSSASLSVRLFASGIHRLDVYECQKDQPLAYRVRLACDGYCGSTPGPDPLPPNAPPTQIAPKQSIDGLISSRGETDVFFFDGVRNDSMTVRLDERAPLTSATVCVSLREPGGAVLDSKSGSSNALLTRTLTQNGRFEIRVSECQGDALFAYKLLLDCSGSCPKPLSVTKVEPSAIPVRYSAATLAVSGDGFESGSLVRWNGSPLPTNFISPNQLSAEVSRGLITAPGPIQISVGNPNGSSTQATEIRVVDPPAEAPRIDSLTPNQVSAGRAGVDLIVLGGGFRPEAVALWNDQVLDTRIVSGEQLVATVPSELLRSAGTASVAVLNPQDLVSLRQRALIRRDGVEALPGQLGFQLAARQALETRTVRLVGPAEAKFTVVAEGGNWLRVSPDRGSLPADLSVSVDPTRASQIPIAGKLSVVSLDQSFDVLEIPVNIALTAQSGPIRLELPDRNIRVGANSVIPARVTNVSDQAQVVSLSTKTQSNVQWLSSTETARTMAPGESATLEVSAAVGALSADFTDTGTISARAGAFEASEPVVVGKGATVVSPSALFFQSYPGQERIGGEVPLYIVNVGLAEVPFAYKSDQPWLYVNAEPKVLSPSAAPTSIEVQVLPPLFTSSLTRSCQGDNKPKDASTKEYCGSISIDAGGSQVIPVKVQVFSGTPDFTKFSPSSIVISPNQLTAQVTVVLRSNTPVDVEAKAPSWLKIDRSKVSASARAVFSFSVDIETAPTKTEPFKVEWTVGADRFTMGGLWIRQSSECAPTRLLPSISSLSGGFTLLAGNAYPVTAVMYDACGKPVNEGMLIAGFSNGDRSISFFPVGEGRWQATWQASRVVSSGVEITLYADLKTPTGLLQGVSKMSGYLVPNIGQPQINRLLDSSGTDRLSFKAGETVVVRGKDLSVAERAAVGLPGDTDIGGTEVFLDGIPLPLLRVSPEEITAVVTTSSSPGTKDLYVKRDGSISVPIRMIIQ